MLVLSLYNQPVCPPVILVKSYLVWMAIPRSEKYLQRSWNAQEKCIVSKSRFLAHTVKSSSETICVVKGRLMRGVAEREYERSNTFHLHVPSNAVLTWQERVNLSSVWVVYTVSQVYTKYMNGQRDVRFLL